MRSIRAQLRHHAYRATLTCIASVGEVPVVAGLGDEMAAGLAGRGRMRASNADREQAIDTLKAAFVQGRLAKDEFDLRVGQAFASRTYAELSAATADLPAEPTAAPPPTARHVRAEGDQPVLRPGRVIMVATALCRRMAVHVPRALAYEFRGRGSECDSRAVRLDHSYLRVRSGHSCGVHDRRVASEAFRRAAAAAASTRRGWSAMKIRCALTC